MPENLPCDTNEKRLDRHGERLDKLDGCIVRLTALLEQHQKTESDHEARLRAIERKGGESFDKAAWIVAAGIIGAIVTYVMTTIGLS